MLWATCGTCAAGAGHGIGRATTYYPKPFFLLGCSHTLRELLWQGEGNRVFVCVMASVSRRPPLKKVTGPTHVYISRRRYFMHMRGQVMRVLCKHGYDVSCVVYGVRRGFSCLSRFMPHTVAPRVPAEPGTSLYMDSAPPVVAQKKLPRPSPRKQRAPSLPPWYVHTTVFRFQSGSLSPRCDPVLFMHAGRRYREVPG